MLMLLLYLLFLAALPVLFGDEWRVGVGLMAFATAGLSVLALVA